MTDTTDAPITESAPKYQRVAATVEDLIRGGTYGPGQRVPSVRKLSAQLSVSVSTVLEAYRLLEDRRLIEARPQSGYYAREIPDPPPQPDKTVSCQESSPPEISDLIMDLLPTSSRTDLVPFGAAVPSPEFLPVARLNRLLAREVREQPNLSQAYDTVPGYERLRVQIAQRALSGGASLTPDDVITTSGNQEAIQLCLRAVTKPGDTVAVETPTFFGLLQALEALHLHALEIATDPKDGVCLEDLGEALRGGRVQAVVLIPSFGNPLGHCMPEDKRRELVDLLVETQTPLIEDDVYGDLAYEPPRPKTVKAFDRDGLVMLCSSFSKTLAPGYRIGWSAPGRFRRRVEYLKYSSTVATATPTQMAVAAFLESGGYDRYLRRLCRTYRDLTHRMIDAVGRHFPDGTRVTRPRGGHVVWVEYPGTLDALRLHARARDRGISVVPGQAFSGAGRYANCIRLNTAVPWSERVEDAVRVLGELAGE